MISIRSVLRSILSFVPKRSFSVHQSRMAGIKKRPVVVCHPENAVLPAFRTLLDQLFDVVWLDEIIHSPAKLQSVEGALVIPRYFRHITESLDLFPNLQVIANHGIGTEHLPREKILAKGIKVTTTPVLIDAVADLGWALLMASARNIVPGLNIAMGPEPVSEFPLNFLGRDVSHATLGIVGLGRIGLKVAQRAKGFQMKILYHCRNQVARDVEESVGATYFPTLHEMLPQCDYVMVCCPLTQNTVHLFGEQEFAKMKSDATIINISRGKVINQDALVKALSSNQIRGAALDVTEPEPLPRDHPLLKRDNVIIVPHFGSQTVETRMKMFQSLVANLKAVLIDGTDPPNEVKL